MQTEAATEGGLHARPAGTVRGVLEGQVNEVHSADASEKKNGEAGKEGGEDVKGFARHSQIGSASQLLAGGIAGAFSKTCTAPLARLTILFQDCSAGACERNWSAYSLIHTKIRNRLSTTQLERLVYCRANLRLVRGLKMLDKTKQLQGMQTEIGTLGRPSIIHEASRIALEEGIRAFWKGNGVTIVHRLPYSAISFYSYEKYKKFLLGLTGMEGRQESFSVGMGTKLLAGGGAGITAASSTYPLDLVRTRLAAQRNERYYKGIKHALQTIHRDEGLKGLYKGMGATLLGVGPNIAINFCVYDTLKSFWTVGRSEYSGPWTSLVCGSVAGLASSTVSFPLDLVRRRMQLEGAAGRALVYKTGILGTFMHIVKTEGWLGLYRGILPEYLKVVPSVGIVFMTYESIKRCLSG